MVRASDVPRPAQLPTCHIHTNRLDAKLLFDRTGRDVLVDDAAPLDAGHRTHALRMEGAQPLVQPLREHPALRAVQQDGEDERHVHFTLRSTRHTGRAKEATTESTEEAFPAFSMRRSTSSTSLPLREMTLPKYGN